MVELNNIKKTLSQELELYYIYRGMVHIRNIKFKFILEVEEDVEG